jgi:hypothetical protein
MKRIGAAPCRASHPRRARRRRGRRRDAGDVHGVLPIVSLTRHKLESGGSRIQTDDAFRVSVLLDAVGGIDVVVRVVHLDEASSSNKDTHRIVEVAEVEQPRLSARGGRAPPALAAARRDPDAREPTSPTILAVIYESGFGRTGESIQTTRAGSSPKTS